MITVKRFISAFLMFTMLFSLCLPASAAVNPETGIDEEAAVHPGPSTPMEGSTAIANSREMAARAIYGPYSSITSVPGAQMKIVLSLLEGKTGTTFTPVSYNGQQCYKFTSGSNTVYILASAFYKSSRATTYPSASSISSTLTNYANTKDSSYAYATYSESCLGDIGYDWDFLCTGTRMFWQNNTEIVLDSRLFHKVHLTAYPTYLLVNSTISMTVTPELTFSITNAGGSNGIYCGGFYMKGTGKTTSVPSIGDLVNVGYATYRLPKTVTGLTVASAYSLFDYVMKLTKTTVNTSTKNYLTATEAMSNPAKSLYSYQTNLEAPYELHEDGMYFETHVGLLGTISSSAQYKVTVAYTYN